MGIVSSIIVQTVEGYVRLAVQPMQTQGKLILVSVDSRKYDKANTGNWRYLGNISYQF